MGSVSRSTGSIDPTHRFNGKELDPESGLYYYGGRYYDPEISRFASADPFIQSPDDPQSLNRYSYVINNPQNYIDPSGYFFKKLFKKLSKIFKILHTGFLWHHAVVAGDHASLFTRQFGPKWVRDVQATFDRIAVQAVVTYFTWSPQLGAAAGAAVYTAQMGGDLEQVFNASLDAFFRGGLSSWGGGGGGDYSGGDGFQVACSYCWGLFGGGTAHAASSHNPNRNLPDGGGGSGARVWRGDPRLDPDLRGLQRTPSSPTTSKSGFGDLSQRSSLTVNEALTEGARWVGPGYHQVAPGVFRSADGLRQFRMTTSDILGRHGNVGPHVNFEIFNSANDRVTAENLHMPIRGPGIGGGLP